jgi:Icc-related predicted phosphoesterase
MNNAAQPRIFCGMSAPILETSRKNPFIPALTGDEPGRARPPAGRYIGSPTTIATPRSRLLTTCFFVSDLHGRIDRYQKLFHAIGEERPRAVFLGGDLLPMEWASLTIEDFSHEDFVNGYLAGQFRRLRERLGDSYPRIFLILGNDDGKFEEAAVIDAATQGLWEYMHNRKRPLDAYMIYGYAYIPPTPYLLKDWERYDVSRFVDPGCVSPEEGRRSAPMSDHEKKYATIQEDLDVLAGDDDLENAVFLFHAPPYQTKLDRAPLDGKMIDHVPLDVHIGSIAIKRFIQRRQPLVTLHGHAHESARLTGSWQDRLGRTHAFTAAHHGPELSLVRFDLENPATATRELM